MLVCIGWDIGSRPSSPQAQAGIRLQRTPKTSAVEGHILRGGQQVYTIGSDWTSWGELACGICALVAAILALEHNPGMVPFMMLFAMGLFYTAALGLEHWWHIARQRVHPAIVVRD